MKKRNVFLPGLLAVLLAFGMTVVGCDDSSTDENGTENTGGNNNGGDNNGGNNNGGNNNGGTGAPSVPTGVSATAQSSSSISVSWNAVSGATRYTVYYEIGLSSTKNLADTVTGTSYTHTGLQANTTYYYYIVASNSAGDSGYSSFSLNASATTQSGGNNNGGNNNGGTTTPSKPSYVGGSFTLTTITVSWSLYPTPENIVIEAWNTSTRRWETVTTLSGSATSYNISPYRNYVVSGGLLVNPNGTGRDGPQGITDEAGLAFVRVRGKNGTTLGPAKAIAFDIDFGGTITDLLPVYEN